MRLELSGMWLLIWLCAWGWRLQEQSAEMEKESLLSFCQFLVFQHATVSYASSRSLFRPQLLFSHCFALEVTTKSPLQIFSASHNRISRKVSSRYFGGSVKPSVALWHVDLSLLKALKKYNTLCKYLWIRQSLPQCDTQMEKKRNSETFLAPTVTKTEPWNSKACRCRERRRKKKKRLCLEMLIAGLKYLYVSAPNQWLQLLDTAAGDLCEECCLGHTLSISH